MPIHEASTNRFLNHLKIQLLKTTPQLTNFIASNENLTEDDINNAFNVVRGNESAVLFAQFSKTMTKKILTMAKANADKIPYFNFITNLINPENINTNLTDDEYLAIINNQQIKAKSTKNSSPIMTIGRNMLIDMLSDNLQSLLQNKLNLNNTHDNTILSNVISKIYKHQDSELEEPNEPELEEPNEPNEPELEEPNGPTQKELNESFKLIEPEGPIGFEDDEIPTKRRKTSSIDFDDFINDVQTQNEIDEMFI